MLKKITNQEIVDIAIGIHGCAASNIGNAKFKYANMLNEHEVKQRLKPLVVTANDILKEYTAAFKSEIIGERKTGKKYSMMQLEIVTIPLPDDFDEVVESQKIIDLQNRFTKEFKACEELLDEKVEINLHMIKLENIPDDIPFEHLRKLKACIADENISEKS